MTKGSSIMFAELSSNNSNLEDLNSKSEVIIQITSYGGSWLVVKMLLDS